MQKLAIIGANEFQKPLILKAKELGFETHVFAWEKGAIGKACADVFYPISITKKTEILEICKTLNLEGVASIGSDLAVPTVNYLQQELGFPANSEKCSEVCVNKYSMRLSLVQAGIYAPKFFRASRSLNESVLQGMFFPLIVKPVDRSGSRAITKIFRKDDLESAVERACDASFAGEAIVEEFIEGEEFSAECVSYQGRHSLLSITKKFTSGPPSFIERGHFSPVKLESSVVDFWKTVIFDALDALGIRYGASHVEFLRMKNGRICIIEIGARMGGDCIGSDLVYLSTGFDYLEMIIEIACGKMPNMTRKHDGKPTEIRFIFDSEDIVEFERIKKQYPQLLIRHEGIRVPNCGVEDSSTRFGYYILSFDKKYDGLSTDGYRYYSSS